MKYCYKSRIDLADLYEDVLHPETVLVEEGIEEKIPKILNLLPDKVQMDGEIHDLTDVETKGSFIRFIANNYDPTPNAVYITWILKLVKNGNIRGMEDRSKIRDSLTKFTELKTKTQFPSQYKDINKFKSFGDLAEVLDQFGDVKSKKEVLRIAKEEGIELAEEEGQYKLYIVTKSEAGAKHFRNTQWCVKDPRYFDQYKAPYYYFTKDDQPYTLLHLNSDQCMDVQDRDIRLNSSQKNMMETEEMTKYVVKYDNSERALENYKERVGEGYNGIIDEYVDKQMYELIKRFKLEHFRLDTDNIEEGYYSANIFIPYNFKDIESHHFNDDSFKNIIKIILRNIDLYPNYLDTENFGEDGVSFDVEYDSSSSYGRRNMYSKLDELNSFLMDLSGFEENYDYHVERFQEELTSKLMKDGYIISDWSKFKTKVLDNIISDESNNTFSKAKKSTHRKIPYYTIKFDSNFETTWDSNYKLVEKFFKHLEYKSNHIYRGGDDSNIIITYQPEYDEDMTLDDYMRDFKIFKSLNVHYDNYQDQINRFHNYLKKVINGEASGNEEIPLFTLKSRKSPQEQGYFEFKENKKHTFDSLYGRIKLFNT
jgi:hypothetical protein